MKNVPAAKENTAVSTDVIDFSQDAGKGIETADKDSFAIPFLSVLQGLSPQIETVDGAKPGLLINTITNKLYKEARVVPVAFQRRYLEWQPRNEGGGFRGQHDVATVEAANYQRDDRGQLINDQGNILKDTRIHYVMIVEEDGTFSPAIISMASTQVKRSKRWLSRIQNVQMKGANGQTFNPPSFSHTYKVSTVKEENDEGSWYSFNIDIDVPVADASLYNAAKMLHQQVAAGEIQASAPVEETADKF